jgi:hypothetical protein
MSLSSGIPESSPGGSSSETALNTRHLRDVISPRKPLKSSVVEPEQSAAARNNKRRSDPSPLNRPKSPSLSSRTTVGLNAQEVTNHEHGDVRTLPRKFKYLALLPSRMPN